VSLTHTVGEELAIIVHGRAVTLEDWTTERAVGYRECLVAIYGEQMIDAHSAQGVVYWEIEPRRMFALAPVIS
jgi:hypothetical protein